MKKRVLSIVLFIFMVLNSYSQHFPEDHAIWTKYHMDFFGMTRRIQYIQFGDTSINGTQYSKLFKSYEQYSFDSLVYSYYNVFIGSLKPDFDYKKDSNNLFDGESNAKNQFDLNKEDDLLMEQIVDNINNTPIGKLLKTIASLPEVRKEKVLSLRSRIRGGDYELADKLDAALDRVLEEIIA